MKKIISLGVILVIGFLLVSCGVDNLNGSYKSDSDVNLVIDGNDAIYSWYSLAKNGTIDKKDKTITFKDNKKTETYSYNLVGDKLSLTLGDTTISLNKVSNDITSKKEDNTLGSSVVDDQSTESDTQEFKYEDYFSLSSGEYEVGSDIKPDAYKILSKFDDDDTEGNTANIEVTRNNNVKKYEFSNKDSEQRIILKDGDLLNVITNNTDTRFSFSAD